MPELWRGSPAWLLWERDHLTLTPGKGTGGCPGGFSTIASGPRPTPLLGALQGDARGSDLARGGAGEGRGLSPGRWSPCLPPAPPSTWHQRPACYFRSFAQIGKAGMTPKAAAWGMGSGHRARPGPDHITFFACKVGPKWSLRWFLPCHSEGSGPGAGDQVTGWGPHTLQPALDSGLAGIPPPQLAWESYLSVSLTYTQTFSPHAFRVV